MWSLHQLRANGKVPEAAQYVDTHGGGISLRVRATGGYAFKAGVGHKARADARIILEGVKTTVQESRTAISDAKVWRSVSGSGGTIQNLALPSFAGGGTFSAPGGLSAQIPDGATSRPKSPP